MVIVGIKLQNRIIGFVRFRVIIEIIIGIPELGIEQGSKLKISGGKFFADLKICGAFCIVFFYQVGGTEEKI